MPRRGVGILQNSRMCLTRIFAVVLIASVTASTLVATSAKASVYYTGSAVTTDEWGTPKTSYVAGDRVYVTVETKNMGELINESITVSLRRASNDLEFSHYHANTNNPTTGCSNGSIAGLSLLAPTSTYESTACYVVVGFGVIELARTPIVVHGVGLKISPSNPYYCPGQTVTFSLRLTAIQAASVFYVAVVNDTGGASANWTSQVAPDGNWSVTWTLPANMPNGQYDVQVRAEADNVIWYSGYLDVMEFGFFVNTLRHQYLPGETAEITYQVLDALTLGPAVGVTVGFSAQWQNSTGAYQWTNGSLPGTQGTHNYQIPRDIALYSETELTYAAIETATVERTEMYETLYTQLIAGTVTIEGTAQAPGDDVEVTVSATVGGYMLDGATVNVSVEKNGTALPALGAIGLVTGWQGRVIHVVALPADAATGSYVVVATISKAGNSITRIATFDVFRDGHILITLDKDVYVSGDTVVAHIQTYCNNQYLHNLTVVYGVFLSDGPLMTGSTSDDTFSFVIPTSEHYGIGVQVMAVVGGYQIYGTASADVVPAVVQMTARNPDYVPLDTLVFDYALETHLPVADLSYSIVDGNGIQVSEGSLTASATGSISFNTPADASDHYTCELRLDIQGETPITVADTAYMTVGYELVISATGSQYLSGAYKPGETLDINYEIVPKGTPGLSVYGLDFATSINDSTYYIMTQTLTGTVQLQIPSTESDGLAYIEASLYNGLTDEYLSDAMATVTIDDAADLLDKALEEMQNDTELLRDRLNTTLDSLNDTLENNSQLASDLDALRSHLDDTMDSLNESLNDLDNMQENMSALHDELENVNSQISDRQGSDSTTTLLAVALIVAAAAAALMAILFVRGRKAQ